MPVPLIWKLFTLEVIVEYAIEIYLILCDTLRVFICLSWRDGSVLRSVAVLAEESGSQYPHSGPQPSLTLVPEDLTSSSDLLGHQACKCIKKEEREREEKSFHLLHCP